ncbi:MAG TPA: CapA family protein [Methyloceanibacter sp.]|nr:CapA family protein [Methyloceanibacter sp.]
MRGWVKCCLLVTACAILAAAGARLSLAATRPGPCGEPGAAAPSGAPPDRLTIVLAGDAAFNTLGGKVDAKGMQKGKDVTSFADLLGGVKGEANGDLTFVNLDTVVTDRNDLAPEGKGRVQVRSHPTALKALTDSGFNLFSLANGHAYDYGPQGIEETLYHLAVANGERPIAFAGIGSNFDEATRPGCLDLGGAKIGFSAIGGLTGDRPQSRATADKAGQANYRDQPDFAAVVDKLVAMPADYRILSIDYGTEGAVVPDERQLTDWRKFAVEEKGIDLIAGHHAQVAQGVELNGKSLIFYSLGNLLDPGTTEPSRFGLCRDYGLIAKVHLARIDNAWKVEAIEAIPLTRTQVRPERFTANEGTKRIHALNHLAAGLDDGGNAKGVRFTPRPDGSGLYCAYGAAALGGELGTLCQGFQPAPEPDKTLAGIIDSACADKPFSAKPTIVRRKVPQRRQAPSSGPFGAAGPSFR